MFVRSKVVKGRTYYQLVAGYRDEAGRVRHRTVASLGTCPTVAEALAAARRELGALRRRRTRLGCPNPPPGRRRQLERLERRIERLEARIAGLASVDTTAPRPAAEVPVAVPAGVAPGPSGGVATTAVADGLPRRG